MTRRTAEKEPAQKRPGKEERRLDEEIEESFPASDPPSYAGGAAVGAPKRPRERKRTP
ncbi:MAG: hypothetical protein ACREHV_03520 [Rhizomicrobium sp.]